MSDPTALTAAGRHRIRRQLQTAGRVLTGCLLLAQLWSTVELSILGIWAGLGLATVVPVVLMDAVTLTTAHQASAGHLPRRLVTGAWSIAGAGFLVSFAGNMLAQLVVHFAGGGVVRAAASPDTAAFGTGVRVALGVIPVLLVIASLLLRGALARFAETLTQTDEQEAEREQQRQARRAERAAQGGSPAPALTPAAAVAVGGAPAVSGRPVPAAPAAAAMPATGSTPEPGGESKAALADRVFLAAWVGGGTPTAADVDREIGGTGFASKRKRLLEDALDMLRADRAIGQEPTVESFDARLRERWGGARIGSLDGVAARVLDAYPAENAVENAATSENTEEHQVVPAESAGATLATLSA